MLPIRGTEQLIHLKEQTGGCLGSQWDPMVLAVDPSERDFQVEGLTPADDMPPERFVGRREFLANLNRRGERAPIEKGFLDGDGLTQRQQKWIPRACA